MPIRPTGFCNVNELFEVNSEQAGAIEVLMPARKIPKVNGIRSELTAELLLFIKLFDRLSDLIGK